LARSTGGWEDWSQAVGEPDKGAQTSVAAALLTSWCAAAGESGSRDGMEALMGGGAAHPRQETAEADTYLRAGHQRARARRVTRVSKKRGWVRELATGSW
jgi:hypothetical protein